MSTDHSLGSTNQTQQQAEAMDKKDNVVQIMSYIWERKIMSYIWARKIMSYIWTRRTMSYILWARRIMSYKFVNTEIV